MIIYEILAYDETQRRICFHEFHCVPPAGKYQGNAPKPVEFDGEDTYENALKFALLWHSNLGKPDYYPDVKFMLVSKFEAGVTDPYGSLTYYKTSGLKTDERPVAIVDDPPENRIAFAEGETVLPPGTSVAIEVFTPDFRQAEPKQEEREDQQPPGFSKRKK